MLDLSVNTRSLLASEADPSNLFENSLVAIFRSDFNGRIIDANQAMADVYGYSSTEEIKRVNARELYYSEEDRYEYLKILQEKGFLKNFQLRMRNRKGSEIWIMENVMLVKEPGTGKEYIEGMLIDITDTKQMQQALQESQMNYKSLIDHTPDGILIYNNIGEAIFANPAALRMMGLESLEDAEDKNLFHYVLPEYHDKILNGNAELGEKKHSRFLEIGIRRPDGKITEVEIMVTPISYMGRSAVKLVMHDISSQRQLEREHMRLMAEEEINWKLKQEIAAHIRTRQRLQANQKYTRLLLDSSIDIICACDRHGKITELNHAGQQIFGFSIDEALSKDLSVLYADYEQCVTILSIIAENENFLGEVNHVKKNGDTFPAYLSASVLKNEDGEIIGMMSISRDITRIKETEENLKKSVYEKELLIKEIHHRVKNNMQVISSILNLQSAYITDKKSAAPLEECRNRIASIALIHAALDATSDFTNINFANYITTIAGNLHQSCISPEKKITLQLDVPSFFLHIDDAIPSGLIINELLTNSFKYGFVKKKNGLVGISVKVKKENIILAIWDTGDGFSPKADFSDAKSLGMQLVISLTDQLSGKIKMKSKLGKGTKFIIAFRKSKTLK